MEEKEAKAMSWVEWIHYISRKVLRSVFHYDVMKYKHTHTKDPPKNTLLHSKRYLSSVHNVIAFDPEGVQKGAQIQKGLRELEHFY